MAHPIEEDLRRKGFNPDEIKNRIRGHIENAFGGNIQNYVNAIKSKPAGQLSDPEAARAMQELMPQQFNRQLGEDPQYPGQMVFRSGGSMIPRDSGLHPGAVNLLNAITQYQQANPVVLPVAPGTKMRWQLQDEEAMRAQAAAEALAQEQWTWKQEQAELDRQMAEREFAANQAYRNAQLALSRLKASGGGSTTEEDPWQAIDKIVSTGASLDDIMEYVENGLNTADYKKYGTTVEKMKQYALQQYEKIWQNVLKVSPSPKGSSRAADARSLRQAEAASFNIEKAQNYGKQFTDKDYYKFAKDTGRPVEEIRYMDQQGWLENFMKTFYGRQYKYDDSPLEY